MSARLRLAALVLLASSWGQFGCLDVETVLTLYPDGSGRVTNSMTVDQSALETLRGMVPSQGGSGNPMQQEIKGLVGGQKIKVTTEGLFADISKVEIQGLRVSLERGPDGLRAEATLDPAAGRGAFAGGGIGIGPGRGPIGPRPAEPEEQGEDLTDDPEEPGPADADASSNEMAQAMSEQMFSGVTMKVEFVLPSTVTGTSGMRDGRRAWLVIDQGKLAGVKEPVVLEARCADEVPPDVRPEYDQFRAALQSAKEKAAGSKEENLGD